MKWPWARKSRVDPEAQKALADASKNLNDARKRWPEVLAVSDSLRELRERNRFAESIELIMRGGHP